MNVLQGAEYFFANPFTELDLKNQSVFKMVKSRNPSLLLYFYRVNNKKSQAISFLLNEFPKTKRVKEEIIYTYLYFKDYKGALDYINFYEFTNKDVKHFKEMINIHYFLLNPGSLSDLFKMVQNCLATKFIKSILLIFIEQCKKIHSENYKSELKGYFQKLSSNFDEEFLGNLSYYDAKFLYKIMPDKAKYLKIMVKSNPHIKKKYYIKYARIFGINKEDIVMILTNVYREWAFRIALDKKWFSSSMRSVIRQQFMKDDIFIYKNGNWEHDKSGKGITFLRTDFVADTLNI